MSREKSTPSQKVSARNQQKSLPTRKSLQRGAKSRRRLRRSLQRGGKSRNRSASKLFKIPFSKQHLKTYQEHHFLSTKTNLNRITRYTIHYKKKKCFSSPLNENMTFLCSKAMQHHFLICNQATSQWIQSKNTYLNHFCWIVIETNATNETKIILYSYKFQSD